MYKSVIAFLGVLAAVAAAPGLYGDSPLAYSSHYGYPAATSYQYRKDYISKPVISAYAVPAYSHGDSYYNPLSYASPSYHGGYEGYAAPAYAGHGYAAPLAYSGYAHDYSGYGGHSGYGHY